MMSRPWIFVVLFCIVGLVFPTCSAEAGTWEMITTKDQMSGDISKYVVSHSKNVVGTRYRTGRILLGYSCTGNLYLRANDLGFHIDDYSNRWQFVRVKFDDEPPESHYFRVWKDNRDGMSFWGRSPNFELRLIDQMKAANTMLIEVELSLSKGVEKVAEFDLNGFSAAISQC